MEANAAKTDRAPCPRCGAPVTRHSLKGLCRRCIARVTLPQSEKPSAADSGLRVRCPQCGHAIELAEESGLSDIRCDSCGTHFNIVDDQATNQTVVGLGQVGQFEILEKLGTGAFGTVWKARDKRLDRWVAIKIPRQRHLEPAEAEKFLREARAAAQLHHPNIVSVFEVGRDDDLIYIVCDFVEGVSLAEWLTGRRVSPRDAAQLCRKIASALEHAHEQGVIHRDIKPGNILLDTKGEPHLADFGLARREAGEVTLTLDGQLLGTPAYMSPEQAKGEAHQADPRSDLYSLGVVLFQLLTGELPFRGNTRMLVQQVIHDDPPSPRKLNAHVPRDLETICLNCLEKEPGRRYESARDLGEELDRYLRDEPIQARPLGPVGRAWRWSRRKPVLAGMVGAVGALLLTVTIVSVTAAWRIATARKAEQRESYYHSISLADSYIKGGDIDRAKELLFSCPPEFRNWEWGYLLFRCHPEILSIDAHTEIEFDQRTQYNASVDRMQDLRWDARGSRLATLGRDGAIRVWDPIDGRRLFSVADTNHPATAVEFHPTKGQLAVTFQDGTVEVWDTATGKQQTAMRSEEGPLLKLVWHPEGRWLAAASQRELRVWDTSSWEVVGRAQLSADVRSVAFTPDGSRVLVQTRSEARLYELAGLKETAIIRAPTEPGISLFVDPDGKRWVTVSTLGEVWLWQDAEHGIRLGSSQGSLPELIGRVFFSPDGTRVCIGGSAATARVWDATNGREILTIPSRVNDAVFSPDGRILAVHGSGTTAQLWDLERKDELLTLRGHSDLLAHMAFGPDGRRLATTGRDGIVKIWSASPGREVLPERGFIWGFDVSPDGQRIITSPWGSMEFTIWDAISGRRLVIVDTVVQSVIDSAFSPDNRRLVTVGDDKTGRVWDVRTGQLLLTLTGHSRRIRAVSFSPSGESIATGSCDGSARVWDANTGRELQCLRSGTGWVNILTFSPEGRRLAVAGEDGLALWELSSGHLLLRVPGTGRTPDNGVFGPGKDRLTLGYSGEPVLRICDSRTGLMLSTWKLRGIAGDFVFSADARRLVVPVSKDNLLGCDTQAPGAELWDVELGRRILTLEGHTEPVNWARLSCDGRRIVTRSQDGTLRQWETFPWQSAAYPGSPEEPLPDRVQRYARAYWQARLAVEEAPATLVRARPPRESLWPARDPAATPNQIDLTPHYTTLLDSFLAPWSDIATPDNDLSELPRGLVELGGVRFDVRGAILLRKGGVDRMLGRLQVLWEPCPVQTGDIAVGRPIRRLHVLHGVVFPEARGMCVGRWIWRYEDGTERATQVLYGSDVQDLWFKPGEAAKGELGASRVVWTGSSTLAQERGCLLQLSLRTWGNPRPDAVVRSLSYASALTESAPFVIAITVE